MFTKPTLDEVLLELTGRRIRDTEEIFDARKFKAIMRRVRRWVPY